MRHDRPHPSWSQLAHNSVQILRRGRERKSSFFHALFCHTVVMYRRSMHRHAIANEVDLGTAGQAWVVERLRSLNTHYRVEQ